ncbi:MULTISPECIES: SDR family NAD(P)-dependent oxidoreductase [unclassified Thermus]|uniref:SDR family NAD(P)-dependent oxidoreductase n=1 Tax=unclassified Thermus TaxID=2619321 RepID=UPI00059BE502|nr:MULTISPECIES: SDR family NAD(P)-dependent oxidoreductase [unclassified Thermus]MCS6869506.1 SDR family oxidoreductase [Thermus sp.]
MPRLEGRPVLVIGATRGIGLAVAQELARRGARLGLTGRDPERVRAVATELGAWGKAVDVRRREDLVEAVAGFARDVGLYGLVYNAGTSPAFTRAERLSLEVWDEVLAVNLTGAFVAAQAFAQRLVGEGSVVLVGSVLGFRGGGRLAAYTASKAGLWGLTRALALDWAERGIRVNLVAPGWTETEMTQGLREHPHLGPALLREIPLGRMARPEEVARMVAFLLEPENAYLTGGFYAVDGGVGAR